ncbi:hypothetical protein Ctob_001963, partial [Chrysochromulina tobinii]
GGWRKNYGPRWSQTVKISWFESRGALPALVFLAKFGFWAGLFTRVWDFSRRN